MDEILIELGKAFLIFLTATSLYIFFFLPLANFFGCNGGGSFKKVWIDTQKHNIRVIRRLFINDLTVCPRCGHISVEHIPNEYDHCLQCTYYQPSDALIAEFKNQGKNE